MKPIDKEIALKEAQARFKATDSLYNQIIQSNEKRLTPRDLEIAKHTHWYLSSNADTWIPMIEMQKILIHFAGDLPPYHIRKIIQAIREGVLEKCDGYIIASVKGYKWTSSKDKIQSYIESTHKRQISANKQYLMGVRTINKIELEELENGK